MFILIFVLVSCDCCTTDFMWFLVLAEHSTHLFSFGFGVQMLRVSLPGLK